MAKFSISVFQCCYRAQLLILDVLMQRGLYGTAWPAMTDGLPHIAHKLYQRHCESWPNQTSIIKCACRPLQFTVRTHIKHSLIKGSTLPCQHRESGYLCVNVNVITLHADGSAHKTAATATRTSLYVQTMIHIFVLVCE